MPNLVHLVPIAKKQAGFLMLPEEEDVFSFMVLNPGVIKDLVPGCLQVIEELDAFFLARGGKRYLSGYLGAPTKAYWQKPFWWGI